jgi:hypothetical protein
MRTKTKAKPDPTAIYVCHHAHAGPFGTFQRGARLKGDHPAVIAYLDEMFVPDGTPDDEMPNVFGQLADQAVERERERLREEREAFEAEARLNPVKITAPTPPAVLKCTRDHPALLHGRPVVVKRGSTVLEGDPVVTQDPDAWQA